MSVEEVLKPKDSNQFVVEVWNKWKALQDHLREMERARLAKPHSRKRQSYVKNELQAAIFRLQQAIEAAYPAKSEHRVYKEPAEKPIRKGKKKCEAETEMCSNQAVITYYNVKNEPLDICVDCAILLRRSGVKISQRNVE